MNRKRVERLATSLIKGDIPMLSRVVDYCGGFGGGAFKDALVVALERSRDPRSEWLGPVVKQLEETEILWLCENGENIRRRSRRA
jgi:hypothetical protein